VNPRLTRSKGPCHGLNWATTILECGTGSRVIALRICDRVVRNLLAMETLLETPKWAKPSKESNQHVYGIFCRRSHEEEDRRV